MLYAIGTKTKIVSSARALDAIRYYHHHCHHYFLFPARNPDVMRTNLMDADLNRESADEKEKRTDPRLHSITVVAPSGKR